MSSEPDLPREIDARSDNSWSGTNLDAFVGGNTVQSEELNENDIQTKCVVSGLAGIILAGASYPLVISLLVACYIVITDFEMAFNNFLDGVGSIGIIVLLGGALGSIISAITGPLAILIVLIVNRSLGNPIDGRCAAISAGSLAGFIPLAWVFFVPEFGQSMYETATVVFLGPGMAMLLGAFGANWTSKSNSGIDAAAIAQRPKFLLSIRHMMIATAWIALVFAIANIPGCQWFPIAVGAWLGLQTAMLYLLRLYRNFLRHR